MFGKYIIGKIAETMIICVIYIVVLVIVDMPYAFLVAAIMTVTNLIPVIGAYIGGIPCALIICTVDPKMLLVFLIVFVGIEQVNSNIIIPKVLGSILGLRGVWIMLAVALFGSLFGIWGMFLSAPVFSILYALIRDAVNAKLQRQGDSVCTSNYTDMFASTVTPRRRNRLLRTKITPSTSDEDKQ
jgi:predicted PurR-regulated permease PerM